MEVWCRELRARAQALKEPMAATDAGLVTTTTILQFSFLAPRGGNQAREAIARMPVTYPCAHIIVGDITYLLQLSAVSGGTDLTTVRLKPTSRDGVASGSLAIQEPRKVSYLLPVRTRYPFGPLLKARTHCEHGYTATRSHLGSLYVGGFVSACVIHCRLETSRLRDTPIPASPAVYKPLPPFRHLHSRSGKSRTSGLVQITIAALPPDKCLCHLSRNPLCLRLASHRLWSSFNYCYVLLFQEKRVRGERKNLACGLITLLLLAM